MPCGFLTQYKSPARGNLSGVLVCSVHSGLHRIVLTVIHLQNASAACRAVVCAIRFPRLAFLAESYLAVGLDGEGGGGRGRLGR